MEKFSHPFSITIKNLTNKKINDVKLFNFLHDKQQNIEYSTINGIDYIEVLMQFVANKYQISRTRQVIICEGKKALKKQVSCNVTLRQNNGKGHSVSQPLFSGYDPYQYQDCTVDSPIEYELKVGANVVFDYIMPNTEIKVFIFPTIKEERE